VLLVRAMIKGGISISGGLVGLLVAVRWLVFSWRAARTGALREPHARMCARTVHQPHRSGMIDRREW
jgi:prolipoprotein diacylglyceryltransferase